MTGISILASELNAKRLEVLKEAASSVSHVAVLWDPATGSFHLPTLRSVAEALRVELQVHDVTGKPADLPVKRPTAADLNLSAELACR